MIALPIEKFESKYIPEPNTGCWLWTGYVVRGSYGQICYKGIKSYAHRMSYFIFKGEIPKGLDVCHSCDQPSCVNPDHLFAGTEKDNMQDMVRKGRQGKVKGELCGNSKLTNKQVERIKQRLSLRESGRAIAREYGVAETCISAIKNKLTWKHI